ncbi:hypothetical protein LEN26_002495 [Aphanomyces euteiches]|nr:hypothetical protein LEN26_002495 [Aphanomyces euteiches]
METDKPGILRVTELEHFSPNGRVTGDVIGAMLMASFAESQYNSMNSMQANVYAHRLCQVSYLPLAACVNKHSRTKCAVCLKKFGTFARKSNCRRCGEVVCSKVSSAKYKVMMANLLVELRVCSRCIPGPGNAKQQTPMSTLRNEFEQDDMSAYSESSYSVISKALKRRESTSSATTNLISSSSYSGHDMFALSTMDHSMAFVNFNGYDDRAQHDPRGKQTVNYFESPRGATPRRRGDMLLLN